MRIDARSAGVLALLLGVRLASAEAPGEGEPRIMPIVGTPRTALTGPDDTLLDVAFEHRLGYEAVARLNPEVDPWIPKPGTVVRLPTELVLPAVEPEGLVINVPEMRLYDFRTHPVEVFAAAIGDMADPSLIGRWKIGAKRVDPAWRVPASIRAERPDLPAVVPPGPDNPLGSRWMTIGNTSYGIHGTNVRWSIGREATHGCIRLYDDEVKRLYERTPTGTPIQLVYQPYKWGVRDGVLYLEVHPDVYQRHSDPIGDALRAPRELGVARAIDVAKVVRVLREQRGVPVAVGRVSAGPPPGTPAPEPTSRPTS